MDRTEISVRERYKRLSQLERMITDMLLQENFHKQHDMSKHEAKNANICCCKIAKRRSKVVCSPSLISFFSLHFWYAVEHPSLLEMTQFVTYDIIQHVTLV